MHASRNGFTLVELSIVLVLLGLLVGGVLAGQSLIRASQLRSIGIQHANYKTAALAFKEKYLGLPGDLTNATDYWGAAAVGSACKTTASTGTETCNGDGDQQVVYYNSNSNECLRFWQHLANAGLIGGKYDGIVRGTHDYNADAINSPSGKISNSLWTAIYMGLVSGGTFAGFDGDYGNTLQFAGIVANWSAYNPIMTGGEQYLLDLKIDDGKPGKGFMRVRNRTGCTNSVSATDTGSDYLTTGKTLICAPIFVNVY